jgi:hypothetical protein
VAHYKQATRYDKENKHAKSRAHLRRALDQVTLLGERVRSNEGVRMVRVFTTEDEFLSAHIGEIKEQEESIKYAEQEREAEKKYRQKQEELDKEDYIGYLGGTLVTTSGILGENVKTKRKRP